MDIKPALQFSCPICNVGIGEECLNRDGRPMARFFHRGRMPRDVSPYERIQLRRWLNHNAGILTE